MMQNLFLTLIKHPLLYAFTGKCAFFIEGVKNVPIKDLDDKRKITATFAVTTIGSFLPIKLIYQG